VSFFRHCLLCPQCIYHLAVLPALSKASPLEPELIFPTSSWFLQCLSEAIPDIEDQVNAFRYSPTQDAAESRSLHAYHASPTPAAAPQVSDTTTARAPLRNIHNRSNVRLSAGGGNGGEGRGVAHSEEGLERTHAAKDRLQWLLDVINERPAECGGAVLRLVSAVTALPAPAWEVRPCPPAPPLSVAVFLSFPRLIFLCSLRVSYQQAAGRVWWRRPAACFCCDGCACGCMGGTAFPYLSFYLLLKDSSIAGDCLRLGPLRCLLPAREACLCPVLLAIAF
jgi:hypothetical protein